MAWPSIGGDGGGGHAVCGVDEHHCRAVCDALGVTLQTLRPAPAPPSGNLQAWARELRYGAGRIEHGAGGRLAHRSVAVTRNSSVSSEKPFSETSPMRSNRSPPAPAAASRTTRVARTSPAPARATTRAAWLTSRP